MPFFRLLAVVAILCGAIRPGLARPRDEAPATISAAIAAGVTIDWTRGVVIARGVGPADRHAPSPAVARVAAARKAIDQARARLAAAIDLVPRAAVAGRPVPATLDDAARAAIARELGRAPVIAREFLTDGSMIVEVGLGLEALRQATATPRAIAAGADERTAGTVVLDGRTAGVRPALGLAIEGGAGAPWTGAIVFAAAPPAGQGVARPIERATAGTLVIAGAAPPAGARVVVVVTP